MRILLLAQGEPEAKDLLRKAIAARYGNKPPAIEALRIDFKGRAQTNIQQTNAWTPIEVTARFVFPTHLRWDFTIKPTGVEPQRGIEAYDGTMFRSMHGTKVPHVINQTMHIKSIRARLWSMAAILLTPMSDYYVTITKCGDYCFDAENKKLNETVRIYLREDYSIEKAQIRCWNHETQSEQLHTTFLSPEQKLVSDMIIPKIFGAFWDKQPAYEMTPIHIQRPYKIDTGLFTLQELAITG